MLTHIFLFLLIQHAMPVTRPQLIHVTAKIFSVLAEWGTSHSPHSRPSTTRHQWVLVHRKSAIDIITSEMAYLPRELIDAIVAFVMYREPLTARQRTSPRLSLLATINHDWQAVVERRLWADLRVQNSDIQDFVKRMANRSERQRSLRDLQIAWFHLPSDRLDQADSTKRGKEILSSLLNRELLFYKDITLLWGALSSWGENFMLSSLSLDLDRISAPIFHREEITTPLDIDWSAFKARQLPVLPVLPRVKTLYTILGGWSGALDFWTAALIVKVAVTIVGLECLIMEGNSEHKWWPEVENGFREDLSRQLLQLPASVQTIELSLFFENIQNQLVQPPSRLCGSTDHLSRSINQVSTNLTKLSLRLDQVSPEIFWPADDTYPSTTVKWPNLKSFAVHTSISTAAGTYALREADPYFPHLEPLFYPSDSQGYDERTQEDKARDKVLGVEPTYLFLMRPDHSYWNELAISIARAASHMPRLEDLSIQLRDELTSRQYGVVGFGCFFRAGASAQKRQIDVGYEHFVDTEVLERPILQWVVRCSVEQLGGWMQPAEATRIWKKKCRGIDIDLLTRSFEEGVWYRWRDGVPIKNLGRR